MRAPSPRSAGRSPARRLVEDMLSRAGIAVDGPEPWDIRVHDARFFARVLAHGSLGAGESYVEGWWDVPELQLFFSRVHAADIPDRIGGFTALRLSLAARLFNRQSAARASRVARAHYDIGNDIYQAMLDSSMQYTCAYWPGADSLEQAQRNKLRLIARKLHLTPGMTVLELGGGFGGLARFLAAECGCRVVSYNISAEQVRLARGLCAGLDVRIELKDYRDAAGEPYPFDRVLAVGLCEHIGHHNHRSFFQLCRGLLRPGGLFLLHTIGANRSLPCTDPWIDRYIFPNGGIPSIAQLGHAMENLWIAEDWHNFGPDYHRTILAWWDNFQRAWPNLREKYGDRFLRTWKLYLLSSAGAFLSRRLQLWQIVLSRGDIAGYAPAR